MSTQRLMTVEEFAALPSRDPEDYELVDGQLIPRFPGTGRHNLIRDLVGYLLWFYFRSHPIARALVENDCRISEHTVRRPDVSVFLLERFRQIDLDAIPAPFAPDIAIEVLSPTETAMNVRRKVRDYLRGGSTEVWLLDHANTEVVVHTAAGIRLLQGADVLESPVLPGFNVPLAELFAVDAL